MLRLRTRPVPERGRVRLSTRTRPGHGLATGSRALLGAVQPTEEAVLGLRDPDRTPHDEGSSRSVTCTLIPRHPAYDWASPEATGRSYAQPAPPTWVYVGHLVTRADRVRARPGRVRDAGGPQGTAAGWLVPRRTPDHPPQIRVITRGSHRRGNTARCSGTRPARAGDSHWWCTPRTRPGVGHRGHGTISFWTWTSRGWYTRRPPPRPSSRQPGFGSDIPAKRDLRHTGIRRRTHTGDPQPLRNGQEQCRRGAIRGVLELVPKLQLSTPHRWDGRCRNRHGWCTDCSRYAVQNDGDRFGTRPPHRRSNGTSGYGTGIRRRRRRQKADPYAGSPLEATTCALHRNPYRKLRTRSGSPRHWSPTSVHT